jgi:hypothetical protein
LTLKQDRAYCLTKNPLKKQKLPNLCFPLNRKKKRGKKKGVNPPRLRPLKAGNLKKMLKNRKISPPVIVPEGGE